MENTHEKKEARVSPLVLGILSILTSPIGFIFRTIGLLLAKGEPRVGIVKGGVICSWIGIVISLLALALVLWAISIGAFDDW